MTLILAGLAMVFVIEGLVLALAPSYYDRVLEMLAEVSPEQRRTIGLTAVAFGVLLLAVIY